MFHTVVHCNLHGRGTSFEICGSSGRVGKQSISLSILTFDSSGQDTVSVGAHQTTKSYTVSPSVCEHKIIGKYTYRYTLSHTHISIYSSDSSMST